MAPLKVKLKILDSSVVSVLCYGTETWGDGGSDVEAIYRRMAL